MVLELAEVLLAQAVERRAVQLGRAADEVVHLRLERLCRVGVVPGVRRDVATVDEHVVHVPVLRLAREPVAALEQQDALARRSQVPDERAAAGAAADHDHVVVRRIIREVLQHLGDDDPRSRLDQRQMRERLREVAQVAAGARVELLRVEPERRCDPQQPLHQVAGPLALADDRQRGHQPERADQEAPLLARQAVVGLAGPVAQHEAVLGQVVGDREHALVQALVVLRAGSRRSPPAASRRPAPRSRSAGAARRP